MTVVNKESTCYYSVDGNGIAIMEINNPPMNALSTPVLQDILSTVKKALNDENVRVIVFTGSGKSFIAGADIREIRDLDVAQKGSDYLIPGQELYNLIENADKPFIAAINGFCLGGGMEFALACHIRIADETAQLGLPEIKLGIIPGYGGTQRTPRLIGKGRAYELVLSGDFISGKQAELYGLVNRSVPKGEAVEHAKKTALSIAGRSRMAVKAAMKSIREGFVMELNQAQKFERDIFGTLCETNDKTEGVSAFLEKRDPSFMDK
ncbi:MAG TPA: enoyl-CoA hydratase-related protein [Spirochaetota bacterium]|nr:enoyl-CoA hydratase-related protein [Spirochaetota bacterium]